MSIKGLGYTKTTWAFEERPVASNKLNNWDDRIEFALELIFFLLNENWGGGNGVTQNATTDDLAVKAHSPADLAVEVRPGYAFIEKMPFRLAATTDAGTVIAPASNDRRDLVQASLDGWSVNIKTGAESASPSAPAPDAGCIPLAELHLRPGMSVIKDSDDGSNGYIIDTRTLL